MDRFKRIISLAILSCILLAACSQEVEKVLEPNAPQVEEEVSQPSETEERLMDDFRELAKDDPAPDVLIEWIDQNIEKLSVESADELVETLSYSLELHKPIYEEELNQSNYQEELLLIDGLSENFGESKLDQIENQELRKLVDYLYKNNYRLVNLEGAFYPIIDYEKLEAYAPYLTDEFQEYLAIKSMETKNRSMGDAALMINFEELAKRILQEEDYLKMTSVNERKEDILEDYEYKINAYLKGLPNTPISEESGNRVKDEVLASYQEVANQDYEISRVVADYLERIEANNQKIDDGLLTEAEDLIKDLMETFTD